MLSCALFPDNQDLFFVAKWEVYNYTLCALTLKPTISIKPPVFQIAHRHPSINHKSRLFIVATYLNLSLDANPPQVPRQDPSLAVVHPPVVKKSFICTLNHTLLALQISCIAGNMQKKLVYRCVGIPRFK